MPRFPRASGVLVHPTCLPGPYGIGDLGAGAIAFIDFLAEARQSLWQVLPLNPTGYGNSPYAAPSAFAGNPLLIALAPLLEQGWLVETDLAGLRELSTDRVDFEHVVPRKGAALRCAFQRFKADGHAAGRERFAAYCLAEAWWLEPYTVFAALHEATEKPWYEWEPGLRDRDAEALTEARAHLADEIEFQAFLQFTFHDQWESVRRYAHRRGVRIVGDIPIFVAPDSADVWANRSLFKLREDGRPNVIAGVPPDYFSEDGQLWGNPHYDWDAMERNGFAWWAARFQHLLQLVDIVRIDHFRGFAAAWEVPAGESTARHGMWFPGPGARLFQAVNAALNRPAPVIAEDLGLITDDVRHLLAELGYPGMKVLQFAFGDGTDHPYLPHTYNDPNCVVYTGTHDNDTTRGWYAAASEQERDFVRRYLQTDASDVTWELMHAASRSIADTAIFPLQDVLDLGSEARMNVPGRAEGNWEWRVHADQLTGSVAERLAEMTTVYGRAPIAAPEERLLSTSSPAEGHGQGFPAVLETSEAAGPRASGFPGPIQSDWYKDAIIYELHVKGFRDSNGDGLGDFRGLVEKLDYLEWLGITAVWLLPTFPSPLRDDGYDIANYRDIHPSYGTLEDFKLFVSEAHRRGLRVITELVMNHTSDQHPWFQSARSSPDSPFREYYVWSDDDQRYRDARIIFVDTERSNWSWDMVAGQYYWHRFFSHQPDLNFDSPAVRAEMLDVLRFWLDLGVDGLRLDAIPYLFEREGTSCENLPETHVYLRELRAAIDRGYRDRMLLAEANQWPPDVRPYFGDGDECHMAYHFPLMPRIYMALRQESRTPIVEILGRTPEIPPSCQWGLFLRNHDELTLEMVTDEERDYMYTEYALDPRARLNLGIRRRLAPLIDNSRRRHELLYSLLCSLPGTPIIYYGDEIGMGDNIYLGDRNGVRTPMQWNGDRNAGFSSADPQALYLPLVSDPVYGYQAVNVDAQQRVQSSLLNWMRRLIGVRKRYHVFGRGTMEFLHPTNLAILAYLRRYEDEHVLVVNNLSRFVQPVELDLRKFAGWIPVELFGSRPFPRISEEPYFLSLGPHTFYWFRLEPGVTS